MAEEVVAYFDIQLASYDALNTHGNIEVCGNEQFLLGRDLKCRYSWHNDLTISREHLRIHCVLYEQNPIADIAPFVYATDLSVNGTYLKKSNAECTGSQQRGILMGKKVTFLLDDGDELRLSETVTLVYHSFGTIKQHVLTKMQQQEKAILSPRYLITGRLLGQGGYGKVVVGIEQSTQRQLACKIVNLERLYDRRADLRVPTNNEQYTASPAISQLPDKVQSCFREFDILKDLRHPNIVNIKKVFWSRSTIYMFQDLVTGGDLFSYIEYKHGKIPSIESAVIVRQILKGVQYLHKQEIVHRDLKPDNILMSSLDIGARIVITDFGNARFLPNAKSHDRGNNELKRMFSIVGTLEYTAPEIHKANRTIPSTCGYSLSVDMWSIGSITAAMLTGEQIFSCRVEVSSEEYARDVIIGRAAQCDLSILDDKFHPSWGPIGRAPKDFIKRLLVLEEKDRMSATEALNHVWFTHPMMATEFDAQYERTIKDWHSCRKDDQLIESILTMRSVLVPQRLSQSNVVNAPPSHFFSPKQKSMQSITSNRYQRTDRPGPNDQFADQHESSFDIGPGNVSRNYNHANNDPPFDERCDQRVDYSLDGQTCDSLVADVARVPHYTQWNSVNILASGPLQHLSTSEESFERQIVDLDVFTRPGNKLTEEMTALHCSFGALDTPVHQRRVCREGTVQVGATSSADKQESTGVEQSWNHCNPNPQCCYDTQAEPITQEENDVLVHETPPEVLRPSRAGVRALNKSDHGFEQHHRYQRVKDMPFPHKISKQGKVYGRQQRSTRFIHN